MGTHYNMIQVNGRAVKTPSALDWGINDISASDAGRTQDGIMHKNRVARKRKIALKWANPTPSETSSILSAFSGEYVNVTYFDPLDGRLETRTFYSGDQSAPVKIWTVNNKRYSEVSFDIIER